MKYIVIGIVGLVVLVAIIILAVMSTKKKRLKKQKELEKRMIKSGNSLSFPNGSYSQESEDSATVCLFGNNEEADEDNTVHLSPVKETHNKKYYFELEDTASRNNMFRVPFNSSITIGRGTDCNIVIDYDKAVSKHHCTISRKNEEMYIRDNNSSNGTILDGKSVGQQDQKISNKSELTIGKHDYILRLIIE